MSAAPPPATHYMIGCTSETSQVVELGAGRVALFTAASPLHPQRNEDAAAVYRLGRCAVVAVADGVGGLPGGDAASAHALEALGLSLDAVRHDPAQGAVRNAVLDGFERGHDAIKQSGSGATTLAVIEVRDGTLRTYHAGDSAVIVVDSRGDLRLQTVAHSPVGYALESGLIDERDALFHANRNVIFKCLGRDQMSVELTWPLTLAPGDTVLLASDGLLDNLTVAEICERLTGPDLRAVSDGLGRLARERMAGSNSDSTPSKPDDITLAVYRSGDAPPILEEHGGAGARTQAVFDRTQGI